MLKDPKRTLHAINNRVTVALPLTSVDTEYLAQFVKLKLEDLVNVDTTSAESVGESNGVILQYNAETKMWHTVSDATDMNENFIDGGWF